MSIQIATKKQLKALAKIEGKYEEHGFLPPDWLEENPELVDSYVDYTCFDDPLAENIMEIIEFIGKYQDKTAVCFLTDNGFYVLVFESQDVNQALKSMRDNSKNIIKRMKNEYFAS